MTEKSNGKKKPKLTVRQARLLKALPTSKTVAEAGAKAGFACRQSTNRALKDMAERGPEVLERLGLTYEAVVDKYLRPLLVATETKFFQNQGVVMQREEVEALDIRLRAIDVWAKLFGAYSVQKVNLSGNLHLDVSHVTDEELDDAITDLLGGAHSKTKD
jgi:hypothetical protein